MIDDGGVSSQLADAGEFIRGNSCEVGLRRLDLSRRRPTLQSLLRF